MKRVNAKVNIAVVVCAVIMAVCGAALAMADKAPETTGTPDKGRKINLAYVQSGGRTIPDADMYSHLIYAFTEFNDRCDGVVLDKPEKLKAMAALKKENPELKVILGVGGYKKEGFSEMARDKKKRKAFVKSVKAIIDSIGLDGVDLDWEFPTTTAGGHTASKDDDKNYVLTVRDLRKALGKNKWISFYSYNTADFIDFKGMVPYVDYVHVSGYNLATPQEGKPLQHQSPLYPSQKLGSWCVEKDVARHISKGVPPEKILLGIPYFGRGKDPFPSYVGSNKISDYAGDLKPKFDYVAQAPYYEDKDGNLVLGFDDERSVAAKFDFLRSRHLAGTFVWSSDSDFPGQTLGKTIRRLSEAQ